MIFNFLLTNTITIISFLLSNIIMINTFLLTNTIMVITFFYTGRAEVKEELLVDFMALTEDLGVEGLANPSNITQEDDDKRNLSGMIDDFDYDDKSDSEATKEIKPSEMEVVPHPQNC